MMAKHTSSMPGSTCGIRSQQALTFSPRGLRTICGASACLSASRGKWVRGREDGAAAPTAPGVETPAHEDGPHEGEGEAAAPTALTAPGVETPAHEDGPNEGDGGAATAPGVETPAHEDAPNEDGEDGPNEGGAHEGEG